MSSLLTSDQKAQASSLINDLADTFKRDILIIQEVANSVIQDDGNYNAFSDRHDPAITYTANTTTISARIKFLDKPEDYAELIFAGGGGGQVGGTAVPLNMKFGVIRLKIHKDYADLVSKSTKIIVDNLDCQFIMNTVKQSLFDSNYVICYVNRQN